MSVPEVSAGEEIALVTGASKGIGAATALALARRGYHVVLSARDAAGLERVEGQIYEAGGSATIAPVDISEPDGVGRLASAIEQRWNRLDVLLINAAVLPQLTSVVDIDPRQLSQAMTVNVLATQSLIAHCHPLLKRSANPRVIGLTSTVAQSPRAYWGAYAASKAAFEVLLECYAQETGAISKIRVAIVNPGATRTAMRAKAYPGEDPASVKLPEVVADRLVALLDEGFVSGYRETMEPVPMPL